MPAKIRCTNCGQEYELNDQQIPQYAGKTITCTQCNKPFVVTIGTAAPLTPPPQMNMQAMNYQSPQFQAKAGNGLAIASLVLGIVGFCLPILSSVPAIILGILGLRKTRDPAVGGQGMAIAGICLGGISLLIGTCMWATLLPSLNRAREMANRVKCASNMKQIGTALLLYSNDNRGVFPPQVKMLATTEQLSSSAFSCPSNNSGQESYVYVGKGMNNSAPSTAVILYEPLTNHSDGGNFLFGDGHVEFIRKQLAQQMISQVQAGQNPPPAYGMGR